MVDGLGARADPFGAPRTSGQQLIETGMAGKRELILSAQVQGEDGPVAGKITYDAR